MSEGSLPILHTERLILRLAEAEDAEAILDFYLRNREHFAPTDPPLPEGFYTPEYWKARISRGREEFEVDQSVRFHLFRREAPATVVGAMSFTQIFRGPFQACYLGYGVDAACEGTGMMHEAARAGIQYMFSVRNLHRIMANHLPENERSARLLRRLGFEVEGVAKDYLMIGGRWRDHVLNSLTNPNWRKTI